MVAAISPLAQVDSRAELGNDIEIGPFCVVGPHVRIGTGTVLESHVTLLGHTVIGRYNRFFANAVIGGEPQDLSYRGAPTRLEIGDFNVFREGVTVNRGAEKEDHVTRIGNHCLLMSNAHVAHNCHVRDNVILVNGVLLGGHVHVHDGAVISGNTVVHHYSTVGTLSFVSGGCRVAHDMPPYMLASGSERMTIHTINLVGLQRRGLSADVIQRLKQAHRLLYREFKKPALVRELLQAQGGAELPAEVTHLLAFIDEQNQGWNGRARERERKRAA